MHRWMGNGSSTTLPLEVFTQKNFVADYIWLNLKFIHKNDKFAFWPTLWVVRGNVRTPSIARWKSHGRLPIRCNWTFFASSYGWDVMSRYWSKSAFFKGGWVSANFRWYGTSPTDFFWYQKTRVIILSCGIKILAVYSIVSVSYTHLTLPTNREV